MINFTVGIKTKKKKKFRKWQKNSGAIFEKGGANMGWENVIKNVQDERSQGIQDLVSEIKENEFYDEAVRLGSGSYMSRFANDLLEGKDIEEAALEMSEFQARYITPRFSGTMSEDEKINRNLLYLKEKLDHLKFMLEGYQPILQKLVQGHADNFSPPHWHSEMLNLSTMGYYR